MQTNTISFEQTDCFSKSFMDYINQKKELEPFYGEFPTVENFQKAIKGRRFSNAQRKLLSTTLERQYSKLETLEAVKANIQHLRESNTYTVTTGHQLNIFTGPLYFIYKIVSTINACKKLKSAYPSYHFVPVYWMASEDHDYDEIAHFRFEGKNIRWETNQNGAVGRFETSVLQEIAKSLPDGAAFFLEAYSQDSLAKAVRHYVNHLFGSEGLLVIDADDPDFKKSLIPIIEDDLFHHTPEEKLAKTSAELEELGHKPQVNARNINFFYLRDGLRERIESDTNGFKVINTDIYFTSNEMRDNIKKSPEHFSPNVIMRPLYQEMILPNLAYIGGHQKWFTGFSSKVSLTILMFPFQSLCREILP